MQAPKQDKPNDPPYSGGEDETTQNPKPGANEPPVDESDDGPSAGEVNAISEANSGVVPALGDCALEAYVCLESARCAAGNLELCGLPAPLTTGPDGGLQSNAIANSISAYADEARTNGHIVS